MFPAPGGSRLGRRVLQRRFAEAMVSAGIPKEHPELRLPRTFHSLSLLDLRADAAAGLPPESN